MSQAVPLMTSLGKVLSPKRGIPMVLSVNVTIPTQTMFMNIPVKT